MTKRKLPENVLAYFKQLGSEGGKKSAQQMSRKKRSERAREASKVRWAKYNKAAAAEGMPKYDKTSGTPRGHETVISAGRLRKRIKAGASQVELARELGISPSTLHRHLNRQKAKA